MVLMPFVVLPSSGHGEWQGGEARPASPNRVRTHHMTPQPVRL